MLSPKRKLIQLIKETAMMAPRDAADYMISAGVTVQRTAQEEYHYERCPFRVQNAEGKEACSLLAEMLCKKQGVALPCGFFPAEDERRKRILKNTHKNQF